MFEGLPFAIAEQIELEVSADPRPKLSLGLGFAQTHQAAEFQQWWSQEFEPILVEYDMWWLLGSLFEKTTIRRTRSQVELRRTFTETEAPRYLEMMGSQLAQFLDYSRDEAAKDKAARAQAWEQGKLLPSELSPNPVGQDLAD